MAPVDPNAWPDYNARQQDRPVRPLARLAVEHAGTANGRIAVELGCGAGREARFLAEQGWQLHTVDADPSVVPHLQELAEQWPVQHTTASLEGLDALPPCDLLLACMALPFAPADRFPPLWTTIRAALRPGAVLAVDLFGERDEWAAGPGTYLTRTQVDELLVGMDVISVVEDERDGPSFSGPKHWHTHQVLARAR